MRAIARAKASGVSAMPSDWREKRAPRMPPAWSLSRYASSAPSNTAALAQPR